MARGKASKKESLSIEERLEQALVPDWEQPYKVPSNWVWTRLGEICGFERGITFPSSAKYTVPGDNILPCIRTANVQEKLEIEDLIYVDKSYTKGNQAKLVRKNDIIMSSANSRELVGKTCFVEDVPFPMSFGGFVLTIRSRKVYSKLLFFMLRLEFLSGNFMGESTQTTNIANINTTTLSIYKFPLPPLAEQQRIVDRIESLFSKLDEAKEKAQAALDSFENRKAAILHQAFTGELTKKWREENGEKENHYVKNIQEYLDTLNRKDRIKILEQLNVIEPYTIMGWLKCSVGAIGVVSNGSTPSRKVDKYWNGTVSWVSSGEVKNNIILSTKETITKEGFDNSSVSLLPKGSVLIAMIGEGKTRGQSAILEIEATINQNVAAIVVNRNYVLPKFLWYCFQKNYTANREKGNGSGPQALNCQRVRELDFILPTLEEQTEIVRILDSIFEKEQQAKELASVIEKIDLMKKVILARAFRGELGTNDHKEESAMVLLKEILVEKQPETKTRAQATLIPKSVDAQLKTNLEREVYRAILKNETVDMNILFEITKNFNELMVALNALKKRELIEKFDGRYRVKMR